MGDKKITVNCVAPGGIKTDMYHKVCREYIPNGENLNDDEVDEVSSSWERHSSRVELELTAPVCRNVESPSPSRLAN